MMVKINGKKKMTYEWTDEPYVADSLIHSATCHT